MRNSTFASDGLDLHRSMRSRRSGIEYALHSPLESNQPRSFGHEDCIGTFNVRKRLIVFLLAFSQTATFDPSGPQRGALRVYRPKLVMDRSYVACSPSMVMRTLSPSSVADKKILRPIKPRSGLKFRGSSTKIERRTNVQWDGLLQSPLEQKQGKEQLSNIEERADTDQGTGDDNRKDTDYNEDIVELLDRKKSRGSTAGSRAGSRSGSRARTSSRLHKKKKMSKTPDSNEELEEDADEVARAARQDKWLTPSQCSKKIDELLENSTLLNQAHPRLGIFEEQALAYAVKKEGKLVNARAKMNLNRKADVSDEVFATHLGLQGGAKAYRKEMKRLDMAKHLLLASQYRFIHWTIRKNFPHTDDDSRSDLFNVGLTEILAAARDYDAVKYNVQFSTYAVLRMKGQMWKSGQQADRAVRIPESWARTQINIDRTRRELSQTGSTGNSKVAQETGLDSERVGQVPNLISSATARPMERKIRGKADEKNGMESEVQDADQHDLHEKCTDNFQAENVLRLLDDVLGETEKFVVKARFGMNSEQGEPASYDSIAEELRTTVHMVQAIEEKAMAKLRD